MKPFTACLAAVLFLLGATTARAQSTVSVPVVAPNEQLSFDRPESWALKYFTSAMLLTGLDTPHTRPAGSVSLGFEIGWLPSLSDAQRLIGFDGTKPEDLNKAPILPRPRVVVGLPARLSLIVSFDPPIRTFGIKPELFAVGLERPVYEGGAVNVGVRGYGQMGNVQAAFTCPASVLAFVPGSAANPYGCQAESSDTATLRFVGGEVSVAYGGERLHRLSPHVAVNVNYLSTAFQVNALTFGYLDHTDLHDHGFTAAISGGVSFPLTRRLNAAADVFYTPLSVQRAAGSPVQNDGLFNVRALVAYRLR
jgi:hypothetical protein